MAEEDIPVLKIISPEEVESEDFEPVDPKAREQALAILTEVKTGGEAGLLAVARRFKEIGPDSSKYVLDRDELKKAFDGLPKEQQDVLTRTAARIRKFAEAQRDSIRSIEVDIEGGRAGQTVEPGGARAATRRAAATRAAYVADADCLLCVGGAQAIGAMAYGVGERVKPVDIIVGPGNKWVTAAKSIVSGICGIDMLAGPSEVLVIADSAADPEVIAADLLAQAEHDTEARPILVTPDRSVIDNVNAALRRQLAVLPTREVAIPAVRNGFAVLTKDMDEAVAVTNRVAPEHLEVQTEDAVELSKRLTAYGGLFVGFMAAEVLGDYGAGPNHVLPTSCTAKYTGGLSVHTFQRKTTWMRIDDREGAQQQVADSVLLARLEGLEGHARAAEKRLLQVPDASAAKKGRS
eukprot:CAMPEP_0177418362 /NCGR_PEP_ID=MMETSP0368-20130122/69140_1 /TAXON_ID=447022 ORGANISM="Scrippsiella hangoei-like, Strain SHHI-4" /NCGR_SAMPLE_ID=MMETSP0368 /ASSEMBLY_ACC=CAM_ASM_000363 /LENGTH=406 /DNA_ID=CAMNT_0018887999 /DNA_START=15 /DNA_END=1236 /DNA_ORIENTATION=-